MSLAIMRNEADIASHRVACPCAKARRGCRIAVLESGEISPYHKIRGAIVVKCRRHAVHLAPM